MRKTYIVFLLFFIFLATEYIFTPRVEAYDNKITHPLLTEKVAELYNYVYEPDLTDEEIQSLMAGSTDEDTAPRWINHFYDPTTKLGWSGKRLGDISQEDVITAAILAFGKEPVSAVTWVQDQELQNSQYSLYQGNRTFDSAVLYYLEGKKQEAYYSLGYVLHLVEDMTVPAHTRQDTHFDMAPEIFEQILGVKLDKGEPYEKWVEENGDIVLDLMDGLKKNYQPICTSLESCLIYLAKFSNNNLFSQDSILDKEYTNPKVVKYTTISDITYAYDKNGYLLFMSEENPYRGEIRMIIDNSVYWQNLSPAAILAGVGTIKYFHEQTEKAKNNEIVIEKPEKISFWKKIPTISPYGELARLWKLASFAALNPFSLWGYNSQEDENQIKNQSPNILTELGITYEEAQERIDDLQELLDLLNNKEEGNIFELPSLEPPSLSAIKPPKLGLPTIGLPSLELPPLLQPPPQNQTPVNTATYTTGGGSHVVYPKILISEVQIEGITTKDEFIELYNPNNQDINLQKWSLKKKTSGGNEGNLVNRGSFSGIIPAMGYFLIAPQPNNDGNPNYQGNVSPDIYYSGKNYSIAPDNTVLLYNPSGDSGDPVDKVGWGQAQDYETAPAANPEKGKSLGRKWANNTEQDTDNNSTDFEIQNPSPKAKNTPIIPPTDTAAPSVVFNLTTTQESLNFAINFTITDNSVEGVSPSGLVSYQFRWKQEGEEWQEDVEQAIAGTAAFYQGARDFTAPQDEAVYYFQVKAKDVNGNESVWLPETPAVTWIRTPKTILINEIQIDSIDGTGGADDDWVELYNPYDVDVSLAGWSIQKHSKSDPCSTTSSFYKKNFPDDTVIPAHGFYLIVDTQANPSLLIMADMTIGWSLSDNNTVYLVRNQEKIESGDDPDIVDKVGFGTACYPETSPAPNPPDGRSIERKKLGQDTNDNSADFRISAEPTPKSSSPKVYLQSTINYSDCWGGGDCYLTLSWRSPSQDIEFYQVQYKVNDGNWKDWFLHTTDTQGTFRASSSILADHIYYFRARAKDLEGNLGSWSQELKIDLSNPIVINETAVFGTNASTQDQWLELYNKSDKDTDLTGWRILSSCSGSGSFGIELEGTIPSRGYLVFEKNDDNVISDIQANKVFTGSLCYLYLTDKNNRRVDQIYIPLGGWQEHNFVQDGIHYSMERISPYSLGFDSRNWRINNGQKINGFDRDGDGSPIYGTPGSQNSNYQLYTLLSTNFIEDTVLPKSIDGATESPYMLVSIITVFPNATLTIEPGVVVKSWGEIYPSPNGLFVQGTLKAIGTAEEPIIFTSRYPESENPGGWHGIRFEGEKSNNSELEYVIVQYAGGYSTSTWGDNGFLAGIRVENSSISLKNSTIETNLFNGLYLINSSSVIDDVEVRNNKYIPYEYAYGAGIRILGGSPTIKNSRIIDNYYGIYVSSWNNPETMIEEPSAPIIENNLFEQNSYPLWVINEWAFPSFAGNQAINNGFNGIGVIGDIKKDTTWSATDLPYIIRYNLNILPGVILTIQPGTEIKFLSAGFWIEGTLKAIGTPESPIIFRPYYYNEDWVGPGNWLGLVFTKNSSGSELDNVNISYAGAFSSPYSTDFGAAIRVDQSSISLKNSVIQKNANNGIWLINSSSVIDNVQFFDHHVKSYMHGLDAKAVYIQGGSPTIKNSIISGNYYGIYLSDWYDEVNGITVSATPSIESTDYSNNNIPWWPLPLLPPEPELLSEPPPETPS